MLENETDLEKQKLSSKPDKAAETTETVEPSVQKTLTQNRQNIPRSSQQNDKSKISKILSICTAQCLFSLNIATMTFMEYFGYVWKLNEKMEIFISKKSMISQIVFRGQTLSLQHSNHSQRIFSNNEF